MREFATDKQALDFIANRIAAEAKREGSPLSEVERKMLYFSETDWTLPEMAEVSAEFDRDYDQDEYERKIAGLIGKVTAGFDGSNPDEERWHGAIEKLSDGDRYLLAMIDLARSAKPGLAAGGFLPTLGRSVTRPPHDFLKLLVAAMVVCAAAVGLALFKIWLGATKFPVAVWFMAHRDAITYLTILLAALIFSFRNYFTSEIRIWLEDRKRPS